MAVQPFRRALVLLHAACLCMAKSTTRLTSLPPGINPFGRQGVNAVTARNHVSTEVAAAIARARSEGVALMEVDFPGLIGIKSMFDDFSNIEMLDANRDFAFELIPRLGLASRLVVCLLDDDECALARAAYPGGIYSAASIISLGDAARQYGGREAGSWLNLAVAGLKRSGAPPPPDVASPLSEPALLRLVVQPCEEGRVDDWLNMELLDAGAGKGVPIVCLNGYLDKQRSGYYPRWQFPEVTACGDRFLSRFEAVYFLKPLQVKGRVGWLLRAYGEPWQLHAQERDGSSLVELFDTRPTYETLRDRLLAR